MRRKRDPRVIAVLTAFDIVAGSPDCSAVTAGYALVDLMDINDPERFHVGWSRARMRTLLRAYLETCPDAELDLADGERKARVLRELHDHKESVAREERAAAERAPRAEEMN